MNQKGDMNLHHHIKDIAHNHVADLKYYPISLDVRGKNCLVVGGGSVGSRKAVTLAKCGAQVKVVSPIFSDEFIKKTGHTFCHSIRCIKKGYDANDLDSMFLVIGATNNMTINRQIATDADARDILCNIADFPEGSSFVLPSIVHRGDLVITVSTSGNSPAFAKKLRKELELQFGKEYATFLMFMGKIRKWLLSKSGSPEAHAAIFRQLVNSELLQNIASADHLAIDATLERILGNHLNIIDTIKLPSYQDFISGE